MTTFREVSGFDSVCLKSYYGTLLNTFESPNTLAVNEDLTYYETDRGVIAYVYDGEGVLDIAHATKKYSFDKGILRELDDYLQGKQEKISKACADFLEVMEINLQKDSYYLLPKNFKAIESMLILGRQE